MLIRIASGVEEGKGHRISFETVRHFETKKDESYGRRAFEANLIEFSSFKDENHSNFDNKIIQYPTQS